MDEGQIYGRLSFCAHGDIIRDLGQLASETLSKTPPDTPILYRELEASQALEDRKWEKGSKPNIKGTNQQKKNEERNLLYYHS